MIIQVFAVLFFFYSEGAFSRDITIPPSGPKEFTVFKVAIDGYIYGEPQRKIENIHKLSKANVVASGYIKFVARVEPQSLINDLYFKWSATDGALFAPTEGSLTDGSGCNYLEANWDAPDGHETNVSVKLEVKESASGQTFLTVPVSLKIIRPYVIRIKFVDDTLFSDEEQEIADDNEIADANGPEYDAGKAYPVCYRKKTGMKVKVDIAGSKTDDKVNNLTKKTEIRVTAVASYNKGMTNNFNTDFLDNNTEDWSKEDYSTVVIESKDNLPDEVAEYEDFEMHWTFQVKNSFGNWVPAYEEENGYSQKTIQLESNDEKKYGLYLIYAPHKYKNKASFKKLTLDCACNWAKGKKSADDILIAFLENGFSKYSYNGNCPLLSAYFVHACFTVGLDAKQHIWSAKKKRPENSEKPFDGSICGTEEKWSNNDLMAMKSRFKDAPLMNFHAWVEAESKQYDPSYMAAEKDVNKSYISGSWGNYEDKIFEKYFYVTDDSKNPPLYDKKDNKPGQTDGCEKVNVHVLHYELDPNRTPFPAFSPPLKAE